MASNFGRWWFRFVRKEIDEGQYDKPQKNEDGRVQAEVPAKVKTGPKNELYFLESRAVETYPEDMLYYDQQRACPKCGTIGANTEYKPGGEYCGKYDLMMSNARMHSNWKYPIYGDFSKLGPEPEYRYGYFESVTLPKMHRSCNNCNHSWNEKPLDVS